MWGLGVRGSVLGIEAWGLRSRLQACGYGFTVHDSRSTVYGVGWGVREAAGPPVAGATGFQVRFAGILVSGFVLEFGIYW